MGKPRNTSRMPDGGASSVLASMIAVNPVAAKAWMELCSESARFMSERLQKDLDTQKAMLSCKSPTELMKLQAEFYRNAIQAYTAEANRLFAIFSDATKETVDEVSAGHARSYDDVPL